MQFTFVMCEKREKKMGDICLLVIHGVACKFGFSMHYFVANSINALETNAQHLATVLSVHIKTPNKLTNLIFILSAYNLNAMLRWMDCRQVFGFWFLFFTQCTRDWLCRLTSWTNFHSFVFMWVRTFVQLFKWHWKKWNKRESILNARQKPWFHKKEMTTIFPVVWSKTIFEFKFKKKVDTLLVKPKTQRKSSNISIRSNHLITQKKWVLSNVIMVLLI